MSNAIQAVDLDGDWVSLGGLDLQINGALGLAFPEITAADRPSLAKISNFLWEQGVSAYLPTLVTASTEALHTSLIALRQYQTDSQADRPPVPRADLLGAHLEGPFLNPAKRGAHPEAHLQPLTLTRVQDLLGDYTDVVKVVTLAPELDPSGDVIHWLRANDILVSLGHSLATAAQAQTAFEAGATMVTHAFNAMPGLHHRQPGLLGAALVNPAVNCGLIADGQHVSHTMLDLLLRAWRGQSPARQSPASQALPSQALPSQALSPQPYSHQGLFLVSDALSPLGLPDGHYPWDERQIEVTAGTARLPDGTLAGTTWPLLKGAQNLVAWGLVSADEAIALATESPRQALNQSGLAVGQRADLLRWHCQGNTLSWEWLAA